MATYTTYEHRFSPSPSSTTALPTPHVESRWASAPPPRPPTITSSSFDGEKLRLSWEDFSSASSFQVEVKCPNWVQPYCTTVHETHVTLGVVGRRVMFRVAASGAPQPDFSSLDAPEASLPSAPEREEAPAPLSADEQWLQSRGVLRLLADALSPLREGESEAAVCARLLKANIVSRIAQLVGTRGEEAEQDAAPAAEEAPTAEEPAISEVAMVEEEQPAATHPSVAEQPEAQAPAEAALVN